MTAQEAFNILEEDVEQLANTLELKGNEASKFKIAYMLGARKAMELSAMHNAGLI